MNTAKIYKLNTCCYEHTADELPIVKNGRARVRRMKPHDKGPFRFRIVRSLYTAA